MNVLKISDLSSKIVNKETDLPVLTFRHMLKWIDPNCDNDFYHL